MKEINAETMKHSNPWPFFVLTYAITWIFWIPLALSGQDVMAGPLMIALVLGGLGPSVAGILMVYRTQGKEGRRDFWRRSINFKQISAGWYAAIILIFPVAYGLGVLLDMSLGGKPPGVDAIAQITVIGRCICVVFRVIVNNIYPNFPTRNVKFSLCQWSHFLTYHHIELRSNFKLKSSNQEHLARSYSTAAA